MVDKTSAAPGVKADRGRRRWHFAGAVLDERTLELLVNGVNAGLERKPLEVLIFLLERSDEVCTKDELLAGVWPGRILSETVLTKCVGRLRDALADQNQDVIKTVYGFGYRFIAPVQVELTAAPHTTPLDLHPGDHPPGRPLWSLVERLGIGGYGEVWRARHDKTHEERVFKFALDEASLGTLKREITAFRILNDSLRGGGQIVRPPGGIEPVAADDQLAPTKAAGLDRLDRLVAGRDLGLRRHGVFQVEDHRVAVQATRLFYGTGVGGGHVERAAARAVCRFHRRPSSPGGGQGTSPKMGA